MSTHAKLRGLARLALTLTLFGSIAPTPIAWAEGADVVVEIDGLRSDRGEIRGALFATPEGWTVEGQEVATCRARIHAHHATCVILGVPSGTYGFAFLHDENGNGRIDRDFIGWPQEGFGFSNDAAPELGPPSFGSASFEHVVAPSALHLHARYGP